MLRRDFCKISGLCLLALPVLARNLRPPSPALSSESALWIHGSPYLGHSDYSKDFRELSPDEINKEIVHFRTEEPWRRAILFGLRKAS